LTLSSSFAFAFSDCSLREVRCEVTFCPVADPRRVSFDVGPDIGVFGTFGIVDSLSELKGNWKSDGCIKLNCCNSVVVYRRLR
jgi:hypothetical protein